LDNSISRSGPKYISSNKHSVRDAEEGEGEFFNPYYGAEFVHESDAIRMRDMGQQEIESRRANPRRAEVTKG
jgi:hypothetical protein